MARQKQDQSKSNTIVGNSSLTTRPNFGGSSFEGLDRKTEKTTSMVRIVFSGRDMAAKPNSIPLERKRLLNKNNKAHPLKQDARQTSIPETCEKANVGRVATYKPHKVAGIRWSLK